MFEITFDSNEPMEMQFLNGGGGAVKSVNGQTGDVVLDASDVGALPDSYTPPVSSVNTKTGAVVLNAGDIGFNDSTTYPSGSVGAEVDDLKSQNANGTISMSPLVSSVLPSYDAIQWVTMVENEGIQNSTGAPKSVTGFTRSVYLPCVPGDKLKYRLSVSASYAVLCTYDVNFNKVASVEGGGWTAYKTGEHTFSANERFFMVSGVGSNAAILAEYSLEYISANDYFGSKYIVKKETDRDMFALGGINSSTGVIGYGSTVTYITEKFLDESILSVAPASSVYYITPFAYSDGGYVGCWNGATFQQNQSFIYKEIDFAALRITYPSYQWRILVGKISADVTVESILDNIVFKRELPLTLKKLESNDIGDSLNQSTFARKNASKALVLMHFSDIHGNKERLEDIIDYYTHNSAYIDDILCTGDSLPGQFTDSYDWWDSVSGAENILTCIGNHDADGGGSIVSMDLLAGKFFAPYISSWGVTSYSANTTYYYKDYGNGVRLIVLDCMHLSDATQLSWLQTALDDAKTNSKQVVIADHYPVYPHVFVDCGFTPLLDIPTDTASIPATVLQMVDTFQTSGGVFVCYITGHEHQDYIMTSQTYPNQLCLNITCASNANAQYYAGDQSRQGVKFANAINLVTIRPTEKTITIKRIGADMDVLCRDRKTFAYDYGNHAILHG